MEVLDLKRALLYCIFIFLLFSLTVGCTRVWDDSLSEDLVDAKVEKTIEPKGDDRKKDEKHEPVEVPKEDEEIPAFEAQDYYDAYVDMINKYKDNSKQPLQAAKLAEFNGDKIPELLLLYNYGGILNEEIYTYGIEGLTLLYQCETLNNGSNATAGTKYSLIRNNKDKRDYLVINASYFGQGNGTTYESIMEFTDDHFVPYISKSENYGQDGSYETYHVGQDEVEEEFYYIKRNEFSEPKPIYEFLNFDGVGLDYTYGGDYIDYLSNSEMRPNPLHPSSPPFEVRGSY